MDTVEITDASPAVTVTESSAPITVRPDAPTVTITPSSVVLAEESLVPSVEVTFVSDAVAVASAPAVVIKSLGTQGPPGTVAAPEDLTLAYVDGVLSTVTGSTFTKTLSYDGEGRLVTVVDSGSGLTFTLGYDSSGFLISRTIS